MRIMIAALIKPRTLKREALGSEGLFILVNKERKKSKYLFDRAESLMNTS